MRISELNDIEKEALMGAVVERARADLNDGKPLTEMRAQVVVPETRIRRDRDGWVIEARIQVAKDVYHWRVQGWTSGTKRDAERSEREIRAEMAKGNQWSQNSESAK